jgi:hypothetical protein
MVTSVVGGLPKCGAHQMRLVRLIPNIYNNTIIIIMLFDATTWCVFPTTNNAYNNNKWMDVSDKIHEF